MRSGFFNSEIIGYDIENMPIFDRAEEASFFAKYFSQFISNGVFPNPSSNMQVLADEGMSIKVDIGVCYINGYMGWVETQETLQIEESEAHNRIDRVVARLDFEDRSIKLFVKKGEPLGNPIAPELQRDYDIYEIGLADVFVSSSAVNILQENITDLRLNTDLCGIVANQLQHVDTTTLFNQYQDWLKRVTGEAEEDLRTKRESFEKYLSALKTMFEGDFNEWFEEIKTVLSGDVAGNLLIKIQEVNKRTSDIDKKADDISAECDSRRVIHKIMTLNVEQWTQDEATQYYEYDIKDEKVTSNYLIEGYMDLDNQEKIGDGYIETYDGGFKIITSVLPKGNIVIHLYIQKIFKLAGENEVVDPIAPYKYQLKIEKTIQAESDLELPFYYKVGSDSLDVYCLGERLLKDTPEIIGHYQEVGEVGELSNKIKVGWDIKTDTYFDFVVRGIYLGDEEI